MRLLPALFLFGTLVAASGQTCACTIPVFRYALDRWEADKFQLILPPPVATDPAVADLLRPHRANGTANLAISTETDPALTTPELRTARLGGQTLWTGALDAAALASILDSPARQKILSQILAGDSIVWVIASTEAAADQAEAERIEKRLRFLEQVAALPIQDPNDPDSQLGPGPPLRLKFTILRLDRTDPAEALLFKMLAGPSGDIDTTSTSFAAAVFGRGRVLGAWPLTTLDDATLEEASMFLIGRCSCRVKDQNPGWDILMNVDWDQTLRKVTTTTATTSVTAPSPPPQEAPVTVLTLPAGTNSTTSHSSTITTVDVIQIPWLWVAAGALIITLTALLIRTKR
jgi:hypothetical protein